MPIYSYKCENKECAIIEDRIRKIEESDRPVACPKCNGTMRKTFDQSGTGFILSGKGWFKNDGKY
jgi:putative FmdB family regulatory protein